MGSLFCWAKADVSSHLSDHALLVENAKAFAPDMAWNPGSPPEGLLQRKIPCLRLLRGVMEWQAFKKQFFRGGSIHRLLGKGVGAFYIYRVVKTWRHLRQDSWREIWITSHWVVINGKDYCLEVMPWTAASRGRKIGAEALDSRQLSCVPWGKEARERDMLEYEIIKKRRAIYWDLCSAARVRLGRSGSLRYLAARGSCSHQPRL